MTSTGSAPVGEACADDKDCIPSLLCVYETCHLQCLNDHDCNEVAEHCDEDLLVCMAGADIKCGNEDVEPGESCDDGNIVSSDGCSALCATEEGWSCSGSPSICTGGCDDGLYCNGAEIFDETSGVCIAGSDPCSGSACNNICHEATQSCFDPVGTPCDDGDAATYGGVCDNAGQCVSTPVPVCDDGVFCNGVEFFNTGSESCAVGSPPCSGAVCNSCQEAAQSCFDPVGTVCDDGHASTLDDVCDGAGRCGEVPWPDGFNYAHSIEITNSGSELSDYVFRFVFDSSLLISADRMASDCSDIMFSDASGNPLVHWVEGICDTSTTHVWSRVPVLSAGETTVWVFHGHDTHTDLGNPNDIFTFFDDFDSGMDKWGLFGTPLPSTFSNAEFRDGMGMATNGDPSSRSGAYSLVTVPVDQSLRVFTRFKQASGAAYWNMIYHIGLANLTSGFTDGGNPPFITVTAYGNSPDAHPESTNDVLLNSVGSDAYRLDEGNDEAFHTWEMRYDPATGLTSYYRDDVLLLADKVTDVPVATALPLVISGRDYSNTNFVDWIAVTPPYSDLVDFAVGGVFER
ncbi:DUF2341 domain-containing protein [Myxococcota bacterium]|nr:DUF2341 domain-containing protein [Myxococcota bacterium]